MEMREGGKLGYCPHHLHTWISWKLFFYIKKVSEHKSCGKKFFSLMHFLWKLLMIIIWYWPYMYFSPLHSREEIDNIMARRSDGHWAWKLSLRRFSVGTHNANRIVLWGSHGDVACSGLLVPSVIISRMTTVCSSVQEMHSSIWRHRKLC